MKIKPARWPCGPAPPALGIQRQESPWGSLTISLASLVSCKVIRNPVSKADGTSEIIQEGEVLAAQADELSLVSRISTGHLYTKVTVKG